MSDEKRNFKVELNDGKEVELSTRLPKNSELQESEDEYSVAFNKAIMRGIMPESTLVDHLLKNGVWSPKKDEAIENQRLKVVELETLLEDEKKQVDKKKIAESLATEREKLYQLRQQKTQLLSHSAESKAEDAQRNYLVSKVTELASSGLPVWQTFEDFQQEEDSNLVFRATYEYLALANGLPSDFVEQLPENQVEASDNEEGGPSVKVTAEEPKA